MSFKGVTGPFGALNASGASNARKRKATGPPINRVPNLYVPERDSPRRMTRNDISQNGNWKQIRSETIRSALDFFDSDKFVQDAVSLKLNHILGAGINFRRRFMKHNAQAARWHSTTYTRMLRDMYRYGLACGFAAWSAAPHDYYIGEPITLNLLQVDVYVLSDMWDRKAFKFFPITSAKLGTEEELLNVHVEIWRAPCDDGTIKSIADVLQADYRFEQELREYTGMACKLKCRPPIVSQQQLQHQSAEEIYSSTYGIAQQAAQMNVGAGTGGYQIEAPAMVNPRVIEAARALNSGAPTNADDYRKALSTPAILSENQVYLAADRVIARVDQAQEPNRYIEFSQKRRDEVFAFFSIPPGVIAAGGASSSRSATTGSSANSMTVFVNDQKQLKNRFISMVQTMFDAITTSVNVLDLMLEGVIDQQRRLDSGEIQMIVETEIDMPGIPDDAIILQLYMLGMMTYDTVCSTMGGKYGFAKSAWNPKPAIDVELLNGIKPDAPDAPSSGSSKSKH